jgi:hypothetical protein
MKSGLEATVLVFGTIGAMVGAVKLIEWLVK